MQKLQANKSFVNDSKVSDHHAIIPTEQFVQLDHMSNEERKIYDLVVRRFLAQRFFAAVLFLGVDHEGRLAAGSPSFLAADLFLFLFFL